jgi:hypothetical protein
MIFLASGWVWGAEGEPSLKQKLSPHGKTAQCGVCHVAPEDDLRSLFTFPSTKRKFVTDLNSLCRQCHGVDFGHGVEKKTDMNKDNLPMDADGKIACAITCHNMHVKSDDQIQNRYHLRTTREKLCFSCHNK